MRIIGKRAPWNPMCLNLSYVTKKILREYNIESTFRLGYMEGQPIDKMKGHAWVTIGDELVTGWLADLHEYVEMVQPKDKDINALTQAERNSIAANNNTNAVARLKNE